MIREEDRKQIDKALDLIDQGKTHASFRELIFKCKRKPIRLAIRYSEFQARLGMLQDSYIRQNNQERARHYYDCSQLMKEYMNEVNNDWGGKV